LENLIGKHRTYYLLMYVQKSAKIDREVPEVVEKVVRDFRGQ
jgi:hypothetical protein